LAADAAIAFPVLMGIRINQPDILNGPGVYYFVYHYTWRGSHDGQPSAKVAQEGFPGGHFQLIVKDKPHSFEPVFVSEGGQGQQSVPPQSGGNASRSEVNWTALSSSLIHTKGFEDSASAQPIPLADPNLKVLSQLFQFGQRDEHNKIILLIEPKRLFSALTDAQKAKTQMACPGGSEDLGCWKSLTLAAAGDLENRFLKLCPNTQCSPTTQNNVMDRLSSFNFVEPADQQGPVNASGPRGPAGYLNFEEVR
jgi:hypothetical protein